MTGMVLALSGTSNVALTLIIVVLAVATCAILLAVEPSDSFPKGASVSYSAAAKYYTLDVEKISVTVTVEVFAERFKAQGEYIKVTEATFTYVAIDDQGHPQAIKRDEPPIST